MKNAEKGIVNSVLVCASVMIILLTNALASPLLTEIAADIGTDVATAGYMSTITILFMGISLLASNILVEKIGFRKSMIAGMLIVTIGNVSSFWVSGFLLLLVGRALVGTGMGIMGTGFSTVAAVWFEGRARSVFVTLYSVLNALASYAGFLIAIPMSRLFGGSWRACYLFLGILSAAAVLLWFIFGNDTDESFEASSVGSYRNIFRNVLKSRDVWILTFYHGLAYLCTNIITSYLPSYLQLVRGYEATAAAGLSGIISLAGIAGTALGGFVSTSIGRRKPVIITGTALSLVSMAALLIFSRPAAISAGIIVFGFAARFRIPATTSVSTELGGNNPEFSSITYALMYGLGSILGVAAPPILSYATKMLGMQNAMLCFTLCPLAALVFSFFVKETGPNAKAAVGKRSSAQPV